MTCVRATRVTEAQVCHVQSSSMLIIPCNELFPSCHYDDHPPRLDLLIRREMVQVKEKKI